MPRDALRFRDKVAIVTGGASGIGAALVTLLVEEGARVVIADIDLQRGQDLVASCPPGRALLQRCHVANVDETKALIEVCVQAYGRLDLLFNNAGMALPIADATALEPSTWDQVVAVNLSSIFYVTRAALPYLRVRGGAIVNTSSISGLAGDAGWSAYNATKAAVINYTRTLALDHAREGIRVNAVCPGLIETPLVAGVTDSDLGKRWRATIPMGRCGQPSEVAKVMAFLASDDASFMTGSIVVVDGGATAHTGQPNLLAMSSSHAAAT